MISIDSLLIGSKVNCHKLVFDVQVQSFYFVISHHYIQKMEISPPQTFTAFLQAIIQAETQADIWKSQLFYFQPKQIITFLQRNNSQENNHQKDCQSTENVVTLESLFCFIQKNADQDHHPNNTTYSQKVISKYFGFTQSSTCPSGRFLQRIKPTDSKLILGIQKQNLKLEASLQGLINCILSGYDKIKLKREECGCNMNSILSYFHSQMGFYKGLSNEALKQITFEANIYGRISFAYLKEYIFGHNQEVIGWETLFGVKVNEGVEKIEELSEENIVSEQCIKPIKSKIFNYPQPQCSQCPSDMTPSRQSVFIESVSQIKGLSEPVSIVKMSLPNDDYTKVLSEISQIQTLLNKTKQRYQKNRQDLQNETHVIRSQHLKRTENIGKFSSGLKNKNKYESLKINESRDKVVMSVQTKEEQKINQASNLSIWQRPSSVHKIEPKCESPYKALELTIPREQIKFQPQMTRQQMQNQISQTMESQFTSHVTSVQSTSRARQAGKIKRRSVSKDVEKEQNGQSRGQKYSENTTTNYSQFEAVLTEIKREECKFKKMVEDREKILYGKSIKKSQVLLPEKIHRRQPSYGSSTGDSSKPKPQRDSKTFTFQNIPSSSRYSDIMRQIDNSNSLSRSRVSSKKREQIVQKATSEARLRIQQIENRALKRIAKLSTDLHDKNPSKHSNYLKLQQNETPLTDKNKTVKENTPAIIRSQKSPHNKNFFIQDLLNERPTLKLTVLPSFFQPKY